jgi:formyl-CoA transferase
MGGLMAVTGLPGQGPVRAGIPVADLSAGLFAAVGILVALQERSVSGRGQWVQSSLLGAMVAMMDFQAARWLVEGEVPAQAGNDHPTSIPTGVFPTSDGHVNIAASGNVIFRRLCESLGMPEVADDEAFVTSEARSRNRAELNSHIAERTRLLTSAALVARLNDAGVPAGPINTMDAVFADPQVRHLGMAAAVPRADGGTVHLVGPAFSLSRTPAGMRNAMGRAGEHTEEVLRGLGFDDDTIAGYRDAGVI